MTPAEHARAAVAAKAVAASAARSPFAEAVKERAVLTVTFHPDRASRDGRTAAEALADDGGYRTQFETGTSSGGLDEVLAGARSGWERAMFDGVYDTAPPALRPRYGGLDLLPYPDGACPRFGSTHLRLRPEVLTRATFSWGDSVTRPTAVGTWEHLDAVLAAAADDGAPELVGRPRTGPARLDGYVEAQIHGGLHMSDVAAVVTDPAYRGTAVGQHLARACERHGAVLEWHDGYALPIEALDPGFRGPATVRLARLVGDRLGRDVVDPQLLGDAAADITSRPEEWDELGEVVEVLQLLKYIWHHLAAFGYGRSATVSSRP